MLVPSNPVLSVSTGPGNRSFHGSTGFWHELFPGEIPEACLPRQSTATEPPYAGLPKAHDHPINRLAELLPHNWVPVQA